MNPQTTLIGPADEGRRLDQVLVSTLPAYSRTYLQKIIREGGVLVNDRPARAGLKLSAGDRLQISLPEAEELSVLPENIPLDILYEDTDVLVVNKPQGMVVHPSVGHPSGTLVNAVLAHCHGSLSGINGVLRPGIVHRIDKDTSGALVICKNDAAHLSLAKQLEEHTCTREYRAILHGRISEESRRIEGNIGRDPKDRKRMAVVAAGNGKPAVTELFPLERFAKYTYVRCRLETGRTHQIRVHAAFLGHPVLGDPVYGPRKCPFPTLQGQVLHAEMLGFRHPRTGEEIVCHAPLPDAFTDILQKLRNCAIL